MESVRNAFLSFFLEVISARLDGNRLKIWGT